MIDLETTSDSLDVFRGLVEQWRYEFSSGTSIAEGYRRNNLMLHLHLSTCADSDRDLCIIMNSGDAESHREIAAGPGYIGRPENSYSLQEHERYPLVFVDICELVNDIERVSLVPLPVIIGLQSLNLCNHRGRDSQKSLPLITRFPEVIRGFGNGERIVFVGLAAIGDDHFPYEIVENGSEILNTVSNNEPDGRWDGMVRLKTHDGAIDVSVCIQHGMTGVALSIPRSFGFENLEMVFSPSEFVID